MKNFNSCYTYFAIIGDFEPSEATKFFGLTPYKTRERGELKNNPNAVWQFGFQDKYDSIINKQLLATITPLLDKVELLNEFRLKYNVKYYLSVVPSVVVDNLAPCLAPSLEIIDFCSATRTEIDIDLYVLN